MKILFSIPFITGIFFCSLLSAQDFRITDYGAVKNDTTHLSTYAINNAIKACYNAGGGRVIVPPGYYKSGTIILKDNVELYLDLFYMPVQHIQISRVRPSLNTVRRKILVAGMR